MHKVRWNINLCLLYAAAMLLALSGFIAVDAFPKLSQAELSSSGAEAKAVSWPFRADGPEVEHIVWTVPEGNSRLPIGGISIYGSGRLHGVSIDSHALPFDGPMALDNQTPVRIWTEGRIPAGNSTLTFAVEKPPGKAAFRITHHPLDWPWLLAIGLLIVGVGCALALLYVISPGRFPVVILAVLLLGLSIRVLYTSATIYSARSYDTPGHVEYIKYVAEHGKLPPALLGWETHQPPLYYVLCAGVMRVMGMESTSHLYGAWQLFSLFLSIGAFLVCYPIGVRLLGKPDDNKLALSVFLGVIAVYPGVVFTSTRISNDSLFYFLAFVWFWLVLRAWQQPGVVRWLAAFLVLGLGLLTKNTMLPLVAVTTCLIAVQKQVSWKQKLFLLGGGLVAILLICGWYQIPRLLESENAEGFIVANNNMGAGLSIPRSVANMATFNPLAVIGMPFYSTWLDETRRMFFAEAFFKSSLFGEWVWGDQLLLPARLLVISAFALLICVMVGLFCSFRSGDRNFLPVFLTAGATFGALVLYFWKLPFACNQDFRFAVLVVVPAAYWAAITSRHLPRLTALIVAAFGIHALLFLAVLCYV